MLLTTPPRSQRHGNPQLHSLPLAVPQLHKRAEGACSCRVTFPSSASFFSAGEWSGIPTSVPLISWCPCFPRHSPCSRFGFKYYYFFSLCYLSSPLLQSTQITQQTPKTKTESCCWYCREQQNPKLDPDRSKPRQRVGILFTKMVRQTINLKKTGAMSSRSSVCSKYPHVDVMLSSKY